MATWSICPKDAVPTWAAYIPPTAKVQAKLDAAFSGPLTLTASAQAKPSAGMFEVTVGAAKGYLRGRILPNLPFKEDFESYAIVVPHATETGVKFAYPPLPWIGARFKWEVREVDGNKMLVKTVDNRLLQRAHDLLRHP
jgi:outer membrane protein assembly factor BamB